MKRITLTSSVLIGALTLTACMGNDAPDRTFDSPSSEASSSISLQGTGDGTVSPVAFADTESAPSGSLPGSVRINVPFVPQAPFAEWDELHQEACEEMSLLLVKAYLEGHAEYSPEEAEAELQDFIAWQTENGYSYDVSVGELATITKEKYGLNAVATYDITIDDIKRELAKGNPVIVPAAGQMLGNPYFSGDGPPYHMLVISGYDSDEFITQDVGTRRGKDYRYDQDVLFEAIHDWTGSKETIREGRKAMVVVTR